MKSPWEIIGIVFILGLFAAIYFIFVISGGGRVVAMVWAGIVTGVVLTGMVKLFGRYSAFKVIFQYEEEEEIDLDAPDPHEGGIKEDSEDPRKYLR